MRDVSQPLALVKSPFTRGDAEDVGITVKVLRRLVRSGQVVRLRHGVYAVSSPELMSFEEAYGQAVTGSALVFGEGFAVSHLSAAAVHGLPLPLGPPGPVHLTRLKPCHRSRPGRRGTVIHHADSSETPTVVARGLVVTSVERTVADCLRCLPGTSSVPIADAAVHRGLTTLDRIRDYLEVQRRWVGMPRARLALALADGRRESWLESFSFVRLGQLGVELPEPQVEVYDDWDLLVGRVDGMWREDATVAEIDGRSKYLISGSGERAVADVLLAEKAREDRLRDLGLEVVRWGLDDLRRHPHQLVARIHAARARGSRTRFRGRVRP